MTGQESSAAGEDMEQGWLGAVGPRRGPEKAGVAVGQASCDHGSDPFPLRGGFFSSPPPHRGAVLWPGAGSQECGVLASSPCGHPQPHGLLQLEGLGLRDDTPVLPRVDPSPRLTLKRKDVGQGQGN